MMIIIKIIIKIWIFILAINAFASEDDCFRVTGEFEVWNGWPPALRLHDTKNNIHYGIPVDAEDKDVVDENFLSHLKNGKPLSGVFCLSKLGKEAKVPYLEYPIILVKIVRYEFK